MTSKTAGTGNTSFQTHLAKIRHDLRTPVGHIIGYSEMLEEDLADAPWPEFLKDLKIVRSSGERLVELINELLGPSKKDPGDIDLTSAQYQLRIELNHISGYCEILRELAEERDREDLLQDLDNIIHAASTMVQELETQLSPAVLDAGGAAVEPEPPQSAAQKPDLSPPSGATVPGTSWLGEGGDILVVDDNAATRDLLRRRLERQGYHAIVVDGGEAALDYLKSDTVDLILLDMVMPGLSGMDVLRRLQEDKVLRNIPIIMLSALDDMDQIVQCVLLGAEDYVFKPFNPILLKARIGASLEKYRLRKQSALKLTVFVSSPGDVIPERRTVKHVINQLNDELTGQAYLLPIFWEEEPLLASETFQSQIHPPSDTDIYLGIFWSRLGSKLPEHIRRSDGTRYASGSEYEFEDAMAGYRENGRPEILVYRKTTVPVVSLSNRQDVLDRLEQRERLDEFIRRWFQSEDGESYVSAFHVFESEEQFETLVETHLRKLVMKRLAPAS